MKDKLGRTLRTGDTVVLTGWAATKLLIGRVVDVAAFAAQVHFEDTPIGPLTRVIVKPDAIVRARCVDDKED